MILFRLLPMALILLTAPASAQQPQQPVEPRYSITISETQLNLIGKALGKLPFDEVSTMIGAISAQVGEQQRAWAKASADARQAEIEKAVKAAKDAAAQEKPQ